MSLRALWQQAMRKVANAGNSDAAKARRFWRDRYVLGYQIQAVSRQTRRALLRSNQYFLMRGLSQPKRKERRALARAYAARDYRENFKGHPLG